MDRRNSLTLMGLARSQMTASLPRAHQVRDLSTDGLLLMEERFVPKAHKKLPQSFSLGNLRRLNTGPNVHPVQALQAVPKQTFYFPNGEVFRPRNGPQRRHRPAKIPRANLMGNIHLWSQQGSVHPPPPARNSIQGPSSAQPSPFVAPSPVFQAQAQAAGAPSLAPINTQLPHQHGPSLAPHATSLGGTGVPAGSALPTNATMPPNSRTSLMVGSVPRNHSFPNRDHLMKTIRLSRTDTCTNIVLESPVEGGQMPRTNSMLSFRMQPTNIVRASSNDLIQFNSLVSTTNHSLVPLLALSATTPHQLLQLLAEKQPGLLGVHLNQPLVSLASLRYSSTLVSLVDEPSPQPLTSSVANHLRSNLATPSTSVEGIEESGAVPTPDIEGFDTTLCPLPEHEPLSKDSNVPSIMVAPVPVSQPTPRGAGPQKAAGPGLIPSPKTASPSSGDRLGLASPANSPHYETSGAPLGRNSPLDASKFSSMLTKKASQVFISPDLSIDQTTLLVAHSEGSAFTPHTQSKTSLNDSRTESNTSAIGSNQDRNVPYLTVFFEQRIIDVLLNDETVPPRGDLAMYSKLMQLLVDSHEDLFDVEPNKKVTFETAATELEDSEDDASNSWNRNTSASKLHQGAPISGNDRTSEAKPPQVKSLLPPAALGLKSTGNQSLGSVGGNTPTIAQMLKELNSDHLLGLSQPPRRPGVARHKTWKPPAQPIVPTPSSEPQSSEARPHVEYYPLRKQQMGQETQQSTSPHAVSIREAPGGNSVSNVPAKRVNESPVKGQPHLPRLNSKSNFKLFFKKLFKSGSDDKPVPASSLQNKMPANFVDVQRLEVPSTTSKQSERPASSVFDEESLTLTRLPLLDNSLSGMDEVLLTLDSFDKRLAATRLKLAASITLLLRYDPFVQDDELTRAQIHDQQLQDEQLEEADDSYIDNNLLALQDELKWVRNSSQERFIASDEDVTSGLNQDKSEEIFITREELQLVFSKFDTTGPHRRRLGNLKYVQQLQDFSTLKMKVQKFSLDVAPLSDSREAGRSCVKNTNSHTSQPGAPRRSVKFANSIGVNETFSPDLYPRFNKLVTQYHLTNPSEINKVKLELNQYKCNEMLVHELSQQNTHFFYH